MNYCDIRHVYCEGAGVLTLLDQKTGKELEFTMCYTQHEGKPCPYDKIDELIKEDAKRIYRLIDRLKDERGEETKTNDV